MLKPGDRGDRRIIGLHWSSGAQGRLYQACSAGAGAASASGCSASARTRGTGSETTHTSAQRASTTPVLTPRKEAPALVLWMSVSAMGRLSYRAMAKSRLFSSARAIASCKEIYSLPSRMRRSKRGELSSCGSGTWLGAYASKGLRE